MNFRASTLLVVFSLAVAALPAQAQNSSAPESVAASRLAGLRARVAALENRVAKLEGQITADDLVGTYDLHAIQNELVGGAPAQIASYVFVGTVTLAADGTTAYTVTQTGNRLTQGSPWERSIADDSGGGTFGDWTYDSTTGTLTFGTGSASVAAGGRLITIAQANHADGTEVLIILTRLQ